MRRYEVPRLAFINKLDRMGADPWKVLNQARSKLRHHSAAMQVPIGLEDDFEGLVDLVQLKAYYFRGSNGEKVVTEEVPADMEALEVEKRRELIEAVSEVDDQLAEAFLGDEPISPADLQEAIRRATIARKFVPVFMGSVFKNKATIELPLLPFDRICVIDESFYHQFVSGWYPCSQVQTPKPPRGSLGVQPLLDGVLNYLPCPIEVSSYALDQTKNEEKVPDLLDIYLSGSERRIFGLKNHTRKYMENRVKPRKRGKTSIKNLEREECTQEDGISSHGYKMVSPNKQDHLEEVRNTLRQTIRKGAVKRHGLPLQVSTECAKTLKSYQLYLLLGMIQNSEC
ncbi:hypothetical protein HN51_046066, partial [Arachis hypogaea]